MKEVRRVIDRKQFPVVLPISFTICTLLALDYWNVPTYVCIIVYIYLVWVWFRSIWRLYTDVYVKILWQPKDFERPEPKKEPKIPFSKRIEMAMLVEKEAKDKDKLL